MSSNNFFLDIFNKILKINEDNIMIIFDIKGNIWFAFKDVLKSLGYTSTTNQLNVLNINKLYMLKYSKIKVPRLTVVPYNFQKNTIFINERAK